jgi:hypothetical protein
MARPMEHAWKPVFAKVMVAFEIDPNGRINEMRECYDRQSIDEQIEAARASVREMGNT